jgi:CubicO group peptidase (beta-lactamase class C family)
MLRTLFLALLIISFSSSAQTPGVPKDFDKYVEKVLQTFEVPGMSIAVVQKGKVVLAKGYGVKKFGEPAKVDEHTLFAIASNTKIFTATALTMLAEEGKLRLDDPVINYLPYFRMSDPWITSQITVRDILVHNSGIPAYGEDILLFPPSTYTRQELITKVAQLPIVRGFRTSYAYDNILYVTAGEIVKVVSGMEWEEFIQTRIFDKIDMKESIPGFSRISSASNVSGSHTKIHGVLEPVELVWDQAIGDAGNPAGGIGSNAVDMGQWLITQLDSGRAANSNRIFKPTATNELWKIVVPIGNDKVPEWLKPAQTDFRGYALGLRAYNYGKYKVIGHGGKLDGFVSQVAMVPQLDLGIAVLTNQESTGAYWSVIYTLMDHFMKNPQFDWMGGYKKQLDISLKDQKEAYAKSVIQPTAGTKPSLAEEKYAGTYRDKLYGDVVIAKGNTGLTLTFTKTPQLVADLQHHQYDVYTAKFRNKDLKADSYVLFSIDEAGAVSQFKMKIIDPDSDLSFDDLLLRPVKN